MRWIISASMDIVVDNSQLLERLNYIHQVTGAEVTGWNIKEFGSAKFYYCISKDNINGTFITAHIGEVQFICSLREIASGEFVIANSCIWENELDKKILFDMMKINKSVELWFARQEMSEESGRILRRCTTLRNIGNFGFQTSLSERQLFKKRREGFLEAMRGSFIKVTPISLV